jgi:glycosyltransferase involved in cell wall biosynthesis
LDKAIRADEFSTKTESIKNYDLQYESLIPEHRKIIIACIPAFNEERTIASIVLLARRYVDRVIVCDDGSADNTKQIAVEAGATVISHINNLGKGASLKALFTKAISYDADIVVALDGDGQHDPKEIPKLIKPIIEGSADIVIGSRYHKDSLNRAPVYRKIGLSILNFMHLGFKSNIKDTQSGFRAFSSESLTEFINGKANGFGAESEQILIAARKGIRMTEVPIDVKYQNLFKTSTKNPLSQALDVMITVLQFQIIGRPLLFLGLPGFLLCLAGIFTGFLLLTEYSGTSVFSIPLSLISLFFLIIGTSFMLFSILLFAFNLKMNNRH